MSVASNKNIENYIKEELTSLYGDEGWKQIYDNSPLLQYLNLKSGAIHGNSKSRRSLANWYAIYSILYFYIEQGFENNKSDYLKFEGFQYTLLFNFQRTQYGGAKLQNHGFNSRANDEFANKTGSDVGKPLIVKNNGKYLIHPEYLYVNGIDISRAIVNVVKKYQEILFNKDNVFVQKLDRLKTLEENTAKKSALQEFLTVDSEARIFEIISYAILETHYKNQVVYFGWTRDTVSEENLQLYKTGRTNANDGGIDFVMRPLGRFFQVTEVDSYEKYFLDMDKVNHFPLTFVVKTIQDKQDVYESLLEFGAEKSGGLEVLKELYHNAVEEVITINELLSWMGELNEEDTDFLIEEIDRYFRIEMDMEFE